MNLRTISSVIIAAALLAGCSGGGGGSNSVPSQPAAPASQLGAAASGTVTLVNNSPLTSILRGPKFISTAFHHAAVFVDADTVPVGQITAPATCTQASCTVPFNTTAGTHTFSAEIDNAGAIVLSEGSKAGVAIVGGSGNTVTITMNGDSNNFNWISDTASTTHTITGNWSVSDNSSVLITTAGTSVAFDNGTITFGVTPTGYTGTAATFLNAGTGLATLTAPDAAGNDYSFIASCGTTGNGTFVVTATAAVTATTTVSAGQLAGTTTTPAFPGGGTGALTVGLHTYTCTAGVISDSSGNATLQ